MLRIISSRYYMVIIFSLIIMVSGVLAEANEKSENSLTIPWDEFKKFLPLDKNEIVLSMETFQKLLEQTGVKTIPPHMLKQGNVVLTPGEFKKLVGRMKAPTEPDIKPPFDYLITKAAYSGKMSKNSTSFTAIFDIHILKSDKYLKVPLLHQNIALEEISVNNETALVVSENGYHHIMLSKPGRYQATALFSLKSSIEKGPHKIDFNIKQTPITLFKLEFPIEKIDVEIPQARQILTESKGKSTVVSAVVAQGNAISIRWRKKAEIVEKIPPKLFGEVYHLVSIDDDALKVSTEISYNILHKEIDSLRLAVPDEFNILSITGDGVGEWQESIDGKFREVMVPFTYSKKGNVLINIASEIPLSEKGITNAFSGIKTLDTVRETGFVGIELNTSAEVKVAESAGMEKVAAQKLPRRLYNKSVKPLIYAFRYLKHPYSLVLDIKKHEKIAAPVATINSGSVVTLFTEDGKVVHRLVYQMRNSAKQFLEIKLPEKADIWSVSVDNKPVESSLNGQGKLLVPLIRSRLVDRRLSNFPVEIIYCQVEDKFSFSGSKKSSLPNVDLMISQLIWSIYLPNDYSFHYFDSTLEKEEIIRGVNVFSGAQRQYDENVMQELNRSGNNSNKAIGKEQLRKIYKGKNYQSKFRNMPLRQEQITNQLTAELEFSNRLNMLAQQADQQGIAYSGKGTAGIMPIQIEIPTGGQVYRFAKTIITSKDPLNINMAYTQNLITKGVIWAVILLLIGLIYIIRNRIKGIFILVKDGFNNLRRYYLSHEQLFNQAVQSSMTTYVLLGLFIAGSFISKFIALPLFVLFWISFSYQAVLYRKNKKHNMQTARETKDIVDS